MKKENIIQKKPILLFQYFLGVTFIFASTFRIFNINKAFIEFENLDLPFSLILPTIIIELILGFMLILNYKPKIASIIGIIFLSIAALVGFINSPENILKNIAELFVYDLNPTDILLHITYLIIFIYMYLQFRKN